MAIGVPRGIVSEKGRVLGHYAMGTWLAPSTRTALPADRGAPEGYALSALTLLSDLQASLGRHLR